MTGAEELALKAIRHILSRAQTDADVGHVLSPQTESWALLVAAETALTGGDHEKVKRTRKLPLIPLHGDCVPRIIALRHERDLLRERVSPAVRQDIGGRMTDFRGHENEDYRQRQREAGVL